MPQMINRGKELIRISPKNAGMIEYSTNNGKTWGARCVVSLSRGYFEDLTDNGQEILATCEKGLFYLSNEGNLLRINAIN
ncbi:hypothetical protein [Porphyromonas uenonis]|jgi:hypothetical protein|uniref:hypothetical protein n=1 Tax=Porphyromonas uenonis TaxID=281920 RepID=UPI0026ED1452|nr:hypothetical protein [Porphyromonas uenonis]